VKNNIPNEISISDDGKVKAPTAVNATLPDILCLVVFLRVERRVLDVLGEQSNLLEECFRTTSGASSSARKARGP
jgi:hypothetical protein